ncbi:unnamed protein product [Rhizophagus irregularis]|nr:unnamed protein product [Rhizophagus irregularis]
MKAEDREFARQRAKKRCFRLSFKVYKVEIKESLCSRAMPKQADYQTLRYSRRIKNSLLKQTSEEMSKIEN